MARILSIFYIFYFSITPLWADTRETREFVIYIDGKEAGQSTLDIIQQNDGLLYVTGRARAAFQHLLLKYNFQIEASEWWKDNRLIGLKSSCNDNGTRTDLTVSSEGGQLRLKVNGQERLLRNETWTTTFWKLPEARFHNKQIPVLEIDNAKEFLANLQYVGTESLPIMNQPTNCYRFRVTGNGNTMDLWYDQFHRLVRQEFTESGHRTIIQLSTIRR